MPRMSPRKFDIKAPRSPNRKSSPRRMDHASPRHYGAHYKHRREVEYTDDYESEDTASSEDGDHAYDTYSAAPKVRSRRSPKTKSQVEKNRLASPVKSPLLKAGQQNKDVLAKAKSNVDRMLRAAQRYLGMYFKTESAYIKQCEFADDKKIKYTRETYKACVNIMQCIEADYMRNFDVDCVADIQRQTDKLEARWGTDQEDHPYADVFAELATKASGIGKSPDPVRATEDTLNYMYDTYAKMATRFFTEMLECHKYAQNVCSDVKMRVIHDSKNIHDFSACIDSFTDIIEKTPGMAEQVDPRFHECIKKFRICHKAMLAKFTSMSGADFESEPGARPKRTLKIRAPDLEDLIVYRSDLNRCVCDLAMFIVE